MSTRKGHSKASPPPSKYQLQDLLDVRASLDLLEARKPGEARQKCDAVLKRAPNLIFAHNARGLIAIQEYDYALGEKWLRKAMEGDPSNAEYATSLANCVLKQERVDEAIELFERAIACDPDNRDARIGLANALHEKNDPEATIAYFEDAVAREPSAPGPLSHLGRALIDAKRLNEAVSTIMKSLELQISFAPAHTALGEAFYAMNMYKEAVESHKTSLLLDPTDSYAHYKIADAYLKLDEVDKAHEHYRRVIELLPNDANSYAKLAVSLANTQDRVEEALALFNKALELDPRHALTYNNIGAIMHDHGRREEAIPYFRKALELKPNYSTAMHNLALSQLLQGNLKEGWANHESRLVTRERADVYRVVHKLFKIIPKWDGVSSLKGKRIFLMHEQGFGDSIQFLRYAKLVQELGAEVAVHVKNPLYRLFQSYSPDIMLVRESDPIPRCDYAYMLMSLPHALGTDTIDDIPVLPSYLSAEESSKAIWKDKIERLSKPGNLRVGFVWGGNPEHGNDRRRSIPLTKLLPLFNLPGIDYFSLQKGKPTADLNNLQPGLPVFNLGDDCTDFADTAAAIANLDVVISVDTSVAHLAGALGGPTWVMLPHTPDWRWLLDRDDCVWYPNTRLFRQPEEGNWEAVIAKMATELTAMRNR
ncbi:MULTISPECIES: tetratricopeptide repeat protein [unclassified Herbaspirillum]|uniref:tetratricopeptide repeat protein n=1 Tax=unclassified Herbaspirillum TaxID=2624150 RepID=UPI00115369E6|nr:MULTISPECIES: tetratricopeptide repeat protein [unclassified Herbaspirillum]MBB5392940.1 tetratricopeptide (TPR) repeat protein [Herbaspirillum sp. SJZ102]TQK04414.1 tetratricopeptide repeat protein [Herbaspirillum sp. SJZ130]TQK09801.1 tetratricopeptide repeat protein [Herbaspirillum sp. SJZ106]